MDCVEARGRVASLADGELDAASAAAVRGHAAGCARCSAELAALAALRRDIRAGAPRHAAPAALRARIAAAIGAADEGEAAAPAAKSSRFMTGHGLAPVGVVPRLRRRWFAAGAGSAIAAAFAVWLAATALSQWRAGEDTVAEVVASHVRATLGQHLVEVASSDRHTVKPWLSARLDYAAPVLDLRDAGFALAGARIDVLERRPVATLVYRYGDHVVDVFVRPRPAGAPDGAGQTLRTVRGFNVARATGGEMEWRAVADVEAATLAAFVERLARESSVPAALAR